MYEELLLRFVPQLDDDDQQAIQDAILMVLSFIPKVHPQTAHYF